MRAVYRALETLTGKPGKIAAMIDMCVRQDNSIDFCGVNRKRIPVAQAEFL